MVLLFGGAVYCFWRAYRIQMTKAKDGFVKQPLPYLAMRLWVIAGSTFLTLGFLALTVTTDPHFKSVRPRAKFPLIKAPLSLKAVQSAP